MVEWIGVGLWVCRGFCLGCRGLLGFGSVWVWVWCGDRCWAVGLSWVARVWIGVGDRCLGDRRWAVDFCRWFFFRVIGVVFG